MNNIEIERKKALDFLAGDPKITIQITILFVVIMAMNGKHCIRCCLL